MTDDRGRPASGPATALSRRALLTATAAALPVLLTACKGVQALGTPPPPAPGIATLEAAILAERAMVARYADAVRQLKNGAGSPAAAAGKTAAGPAVLGVLQSVQAEHAAHLGQLNSRLSRPANAGPLPSASASGGLGSSPAVGATGQGLSTVLSGLEHAEKTASDQYLAQLAGLPPSLAQLFASIAASEATHVPYLRDARRGR